MRPVRVEEDPADAFQWRGHFGENQTVAVFGLRGNVQVRGTDGSEASIRAAKYGDSRDFDRIRIETEHVVDVEGCAGLGVAHERLRIAHMDANSFQPGIAS
jgi:hypothetical protein